MTNTLIREAQRLNTLLEELMHATMDYHVDLDRAIGLSEADMTDLGYIQRDMERRLDELRKECKARQEGIGRLLCLAIVSRFGRDSSTELIARGVLAIASPDVKKKPIMPKKGTPEYTELLTYFGMTDQRLIDSGSVSLHYMHLSAHITQLAEEGKNPPACLRTETEPRVTYRKSKR